MHAIFISLYHSYVVSFCIYDLCILFMGKTKKQRDKQTHNDNNDNDNTYKVENSG